jgi:hypothetical protein
MHIDWQALKEPVWKWTQRIAVFYLLQSSLLYLCGCVIAGKPISPVESIRFQNHVIQYRPQRSAARALPVAAEGASFVPPALTRKPASQAEPAGVRTNQTSAPVWVAIRKTAVMEHRDAASRVVAVLEAGTPVRYLVQRAQGWLEIEEIVRDGSHTPAHGFVQRNDMDLANE